MAPLGTLSTNAARPAAPPLKTRVVPSRYAAAGTGGAGMPSVRSQLETALAAAAAAAKSEAAASAQAACLTAECAVLRKCLRSELRLTDTALADAARLSRKLEEERAAEAAARATSEAASIDMQSRARELEVELVSSEAELAESRADASRLRSELESLRGSLRQARDTALAERSRADAAEERERRARGRAAELEESVAVSAGHFETLRVALCKDSGGIVPLAQRVLGEFSTLAFERRLLSEAPFASLQDTLVKLSMEASALTEWLPWFVSCRAVESAQLVAGGAGTDEAHVLARPARTGGGERGFARLCVEGCDAGELALSPELGVVAREGQVGMLDGPALQLVPKLHALASPGERVGCCLPERSLDSRPYPVGALAAVAPTP